MKRPAWVRTRCATGVTAQAVIDYTYAGLNISDPTNDAAEFPGTPSEYVYDIVEVCTEAVGAVLLVHFELRDDMTDLCLFIGQVFFDTDRDETTGASTDLNLYCTVGSDIGAEYVVYFDLPEDPVHLSTWSGNDTGPTASKALVACQPRYALSPGDG